MNVPKAGRLRVVLCVLGLVVASGGAGAVLADTGAKRVADGGAGAASAAHGSAAGAAALAQADGAQNDSGNESRRSVLVRSAAVTVGDTRVGVEEALLTVRRGTGSLFVKTLTSQNPDEDASVTNLRVAVGERFVRRLASGASGFEGAQYAVSVGRVAVGSLEYRPGTAVLRGVLGAAPAQTEANETTEPGADRSSFTVTNFTGPETVPVGEQYTVSARVTNPGGQNGTEIVRYEFGDVSLGRQVVRLAPNASTNVTFQVSSATLPDSPGTYTHSVQAFDSNATAPIRFVAANATGGNGTAGNDSAANATRPLVGA
ncbi:CARDB domain-containing protein [Halorussus salinus]|uniref:CARDB domain-containing protein n=1 Tax=Halorussus salinus TaxID=1364935 RepID=UPI0010921AE4|nr:CARDB domain-containing protein [Halorussus salinus]